MYCGDETGAFVGDLGHNCSRFGYGGDDCPKHVVPSWSLAGGACPGSTLNCPPGILEGAEKSEDIVPIFDWSRSGGGVHPDDHLDSDLVSSWDAYEAAWSNAFVALRVRDGKKHSTGAGGGRQEEEGACIHPVLAVDGGHTCYGRDNLKGRDGDGGGGGPAAPSDRQRLRQRSEMIELLFEKFGAPAVFIAPSPMLAAFGHGKQTGLVVDVGGGGTRVTPVVDGLVLRSAQRRSGRGGEWLGSVHARALTDFCGAADVVPRYALGSSIGAGGRKRRVAYGPSHAVRGTVFHRVAVADLMYELLTASHIKLPVWREDISVPFVGYDGERKRKREDDDDNEGGTDDKGDDDDAGEEEEEDDEVQGTSYILPDGTKVDLAMSRQGRDLCRLPELFFTEEVPFVDLPEEIPSPSTGSIAENTLSAAPIQRLVTSSLTAVGDGDARKELCGSILLTGASSLFPNMDARLSYEISCLAPSAYKCKVVASRNSIERRYASWIGGSILTSLGSFQQLWLSRAEYEEYGATMASNRFA
jgi:actin-related protein